MRALGISEPGSSGGYRSGMHELPCQRKLYLEARTSAWTAVDFDGPPMLAHDAIRNRKPQSGPLFRAFCGEERVVDTGHVLGWNALPAIHYIDTCEPVFTTGPHSQRSSGFHRIARIQEKIQENLLQLA